MNEYEMGIEIKKMIDEIVEKSGKSAIAPLELVNQIPSWTYMKNRTSSEVLMGIHMYLQGLIRGLYLKNGC